LTKSGRYYYDWKAAAEPAVSDHASGNGFKREARLSYMDVDGPRGNDEPWTDVGGTRNLRSVWTIPTQAYPEAHFSTFPPALVEPCIKAGTKPGDVVLDPFAGSGTVGEVAKRFGCGAVLIEAQPKYRKLIERRLSQGVML
jgi:DNA modification methylase